MKHKNIKYQMINYIRAAVVLVVFMLTCLFLLKAGNAFYKRTSAANLRSYELRTSLSYVASQIRSCDSNGFLELVEKDGVPVMKLRKDTGHTTLIYYRDDALYQLDLQQTDEYKLDDGVKVMDIAKLTFAMEKDNLLMLTAVNSAGEEQSLRLSLRSGGH